MVNGIGYPELEKGLSFELFMNTLVIQISDFIFESVVTAVSAQYKKQNLILDEKTFQSFPYACYATDVTFEQSYRPGRTYRKVRNISMKSINLMDIKLKYMCFPTVLRLVDLYTIQGLFLI